MMHLRAGGGARIADEDKDVARAAPLQHAEIEVARGEMILCDGAAFQEHVEP